MSADADFLREIVADPADDGPRLIYADWMEENAGTFECAQCGNGGIWKLPGVCPICHGSGNVSDGRAERAEFIRCQCKLADAAPKNECDAGKVDPNCERCCGEGRGHNSVLQRLPCKSCWTALRRRERELLLGCGERWLMPPLVWKPVAPQMGWEFHRGFISVLECTAADWLLNADAITAAAPIEEVRLTTGPDDGYRWRERLEGRWPRLKFTLPEFGPYVSREAFERRLEGGSPEWRQRHDV